MGLFARIRTQLTFRANIRQARHPAGSPKGGQFKSLSTGGGVPERDKFTSPYLDTPEPSATQLDVMYRTPGHPYPQGHWDHRGGLSVRTHDGRTITGPDYATQAQRCVRIAATGDPDAGDGFVYSPEGHELWGLHGAAGALARSTNSDGETVYFLGQRSAAVHGGAGQWAMPGGALDRGESPAYGAVRELHEEVGVDLTGMELNDVPQIRNDVIPGEWAYTTVIVDVPEPFEPVSAHGGHAWETKRTGWFTAGDLEVMSANGQLHPGFAQVLPAILRG